METIDQGHAEELLVFFKALADENRLRIVGLLAQQSYTVEKLAATLGLSASTTSHHLSQLARAGLVAARAEGYYSIYALQTDVLHHMAQRLLSADELPSLAHTPPRKEKPSDAERQADFERKVRGAFLDPDGRIMLFPAQQKKYRVLLRHVLNAFERGVHYPEKQVNEILLRFNEDTASLRRDLVAFQMMTREGGGGAYWRID